MVARVVKHKRIKTRNYTVFLQVYGRADFVPGKLVNFPYDGGKRTERNAEQDVNDKLFSVFRLTQKNFHYRKTENHKHKAPHRVKTIVKRRKNEIEIVPRAY